MPFQYTIANLLASDESVVAAMFLDESGEAVHVACSEFSPYKMKILGAYVGIYMRHLTTVLESSGCGSPRTLHIEKEGLHLYAAQLPEAYYLVLVQRRPAIFARATEALELARQEIAREVFAELT